MIETSAETVKRYLANAISVQSELTSQMEGFATGGESSGMQSVFGQHAVDSKRHEEELTGRLELLGGSVSTARNFLSQIFGRGFGAAQAGSGAGNSANWSLVAAYIAESNVIATYEALAYITEAAGDPETEALVRRIQEEEKVAAQQFWDLIPAAATEAFGGLRRPEVSS